MARLTHNDRVGSNSFIASIPIEPNQTASNGPSSPSPSTGHRSELKVPDVNPIPLLGPTKNGDRHELTSPTAMPKADRFLWNQKMMIQVTCRGYATAQFIQPEPAKYAHAPNIEAKTFMQPEQAYYTHHPGRFAYIKDEESGEIFSAP
jgi:cellobionic acid phosphorylase